MSNALEKMAKLLPQGNPPDGAQNSPISTAAAEVGSNSSRGYHATTKASIVEMAVEYIECLQNEIVEMKRRLEEESRQQMLEEHQNKAA
jgi:hypothetical protein